MTKTCHNCEHFIRSPKECLVANKVLQKYTKQELKLWLDFPKEPNDCSLFETKQYNENRKTMKTLKQLIEWTEEGDVSQYTGAIGEEKEINYFAFDDLHVCKNCRHPKSFHRKWKNKENCLYGSNRQPNCPCKKYQEK